MAPILYPKAKEQFLQGGINLATANVKVVAVDLQDYTYSATHEFLSDIPAAARIATSPNLANKTFTGGVFDADDLTPLAANVTGDQFEALVIYVDTGTATTSRLILYMDTGTGLPFTPNTGAANVTWDNTAGVKIFAI